MIKQSIMRLPLTSVIFCLSSITLCAQDIRSSTIVWHISSTTQLDPFDVSQQESTVKTVKGSSIEWGKVDGSVMQFSIGDIIGTWPNVSRDGEITFEVSAGEKRGTMTFLRNAGEAKIRVLLTREGVPEMLELAVDGFDVIIGQ